MDIPATLRPSPKIAYPPYSAGTKNIEEYFYDYATSHFPLPTSDYTYVPAFWTHYYIQHSFGRDPMPEHEEVMARIINSPKKYFTVVQYDDGILGNLPSNLTVFSAGCAGKPGAKPFIPIPLLADGFPAGQIREQHQREHLICFAGSLDTHPVRKKMAEYFKGKSGVVFAEKLPAEEYAELMQNSIFTLCPRGYGITSFRLYEALKCGSIPVYIFEDGEMCHIPEAIHRHSLLIKASRSDMECLSHPFGELGRDLYTWLGSVSSIGGAQSAFKRIRNNQHLLTMEHTAQTILETLQTL